MTLTFPAYSTVTEIQHHFACAGFSRDVAATVLRNDQPFGNNQEKTQEGNDR
ncbi:MULTISPECIES: hypothetical protein [unclassified Mesorhizobium]|jgi:hypothetical protein|uniref:hypothetical protein n=1 Tax=unclassified Mesorhizobium TaxID=325217 RepID=UPI0015E3CEC9|nr:MULTISPECIES: hypothetical protein [unclassified Mesorhizobium]